MITKEQALTEDIFHEDGCRIETGPKGKVTAICRQWRRNGKTKTWKKNPECFEVPVKYGLRAYGRITRDTTGIHAACDCPVFR